MLDLSCVLLYGRTGRLWMRQERQIGSAQPPRESRKKAAVRREGPVGRMQTPSTPISGTREGGREEDGGALASSMRSA